MQSPVLERLVGGAVLLGLLLFLALLIGPRQGVRAPDDEGGIDVALSYTPAQSSESSPAATPAARWGVQVGSFEERDNAVRLSGWCRERGYDVRIAPATGQSATLYRVHVGPFATRDRARSAMAELALLGRSAFVTDWSD